MSARIDDDPGVSIYTGAMQIPTLHDIEAAATRIAGWARETPLLESPLANAALGGRLLVKAECLQRTGSFKFRGAYNRLSQLEAGSSVVAFSSGNHAQGVAHAAELLALPAVIVMPSDAPAAKIAATRAYGAEVVLYDRIAEDREAIGRRVAQERGAVVVPPFDDPHIICGQGTAGLELCRQAEAVGAAIDEVIVCCSGGGLLSGIAIAVKALSPGAAIFSAEPADFDDMARSLMQGARVGNARLSGSIQDALQAPMPGEITFPIAHRLVTGGVAVSDQEALRAMAFAFQHFKIVLEPGGAAALAAVLAGRRDIKGRTIAVIASGGNVDPALFAQALSA